MIQKDPLVSILVFALTGGVAVLAIHDHFIGVQPDVAAVVTPQIDKARGDISETRAEILSRLDRMTEVEAKRGPASITPPASLHTNLIQPLTVAHLPLAEPITVAQPPIQPAAAEPWSVRGFNATTKTVLPVAILAPNSGDPSHYRDQPAAADLAGLLARDLHIVSQRDAGLFVKISEVHAASRQSGQACPGSYDSEWIGKANVTLGVLWADNNVPFFSGDLTGSSSACNEDAATEAARNDALSKVAEKLLAIANQPPLRGTVAP